MVQLRNVRALLVACAAVPVLSTSSGAQLSVGGRAWTHETGLGVTSARDQNGNDVTANEQQNDWTANGSGFVVRGDYGFKEIFTAFLELGDSPVSLVSAEPDERRSDYAFEDGFRWALGVTARQKFGLKGLFWGAEVSFNGTTSDYTVRRGGGPNVRDVDFAYRETAFVIEGIAGKEFPNASLYGGLRLVLLDAEFEEDDPNETASELVDFERDGAIDLVAGVRTEVAGTGAFLELSVLGSWGAAAGVVFQF